MFFWLIAIPFFVIIAMFTLFRFPSDDLHKPEDIQDTAMAFRMAMQHDAAVKLMQEYQADSELDMFDEGSYDLGGDAWKETILTSGYLPSSFIPDTDNITTYIRCLNGLRQIASCRGANGIYMITAATPPSSDSITTRWFEKKGAVNLASQLKKFEGSFPVKPNVALPRKPRKEEGESDEAFAIRLNTYKENKEKYQLLKRNYYDFGTKLPHPSTTIGQVRAYPFNDENADSRVIVRRIKAIEGDVVFDKEYLPTDLPTGIANNEAMDFNGEAVIFTASGSCSEAPCSCTKGTDCGAGAYCLSDTCSANCGAYGADENRTCYTTCTTDSQCPEGYFCDSGVCEEANPAGTVVYEVTGVDTLNLSSTIQQIGTYPIPSSGKYQVRLAGQGRGSAGGVLVADTYYNAGTAITIKAIKGGKGNTVSGSEQGSSLGEGGAGVALWNSSVTTGAPTLAAGGGVQNWGCGSGLVGGNAGRGSSYRGYSWDGNRGSSTSSCKNTSCNVGATGGDYTDRTFSANRGWGGTGTTKEACSSAGYSHCVTITGGNLPWQYTTDGNVYPATNYGNWVAGGSPGYAVIVYCGPNTNSACPASCDVNTACTTGTCNYHTGLCE